MLSLVAADVWNGLEATIRTLIEILCNLVVLGRDVAAELLFHGTPGPFRVIYDILVKSANGVYHVDRFRLNVVGAELEERSVRHPGHILKILMLHEHIKLRTREHKEQSDRDEGADGAWHRRKRWLLVERQSDGLGVYVVAVQRLVEPVRAALLAAGDSRPSPLGPLIILKVHPKYINTLNHA